MTKQDDLRRIRPVILSGGSGTRLWPLSRSGYPKQFLPLNGEWTMIQETARRLAGDHMDPPMVICNEDHRFIVAEQLRVCGCQPGDIILEPMGRNTAPAVCIAALRVVEEDGDLMLVMPSDHVIGRPDRFRAAVHAAAQAAAAGALVTFGVHPSGPETGYGYIKTGAALAELPGVHAVECFVEKPDQATAETYVANGHYLWNSGIFLFSASAYLAELERLHPEIVAACRRALAQAQRDLSFLRLDAEAFRASPSISVDYAVMEKTPHAAVVPVDMAWSDVGAWSALWDIGDKDESGNVTVGDVLLEDSKNNYIRSDMGCLTTLVGVENLVVVATDDAILVADRRRSQDVKAIVERLKLQDRNEHVLHTTVHRPWGSYRGVDIGERFQVKRITVKPGEKLSLQRHFHRAEHWIVVEGTALVTRGEEQIFVYENQSIYIPMGTVHRLENPGKLPLHVIEVQSGGYLGEDDIVRFDDRYART